MRIRTVILSSLIAISTPIFSTGCAAIIPAIPTIVSVVTDTLVILELINSTVQEYLKANPETPDSVREKYLSCYQKALNSLNAAQHSLRGVTAVNQSEYDIAFKEFREAYWELTRLLRKEGLLRSGRLMSPSGPVLVPEPEALTFKVQ